MANLKGRPKGSKNKSKIKIKQEIKPNIEPEVKIDTIPVKNNDTLPTSSVEYGIFSTEDRESIYENAERFNRGETEMSSTSEVTNDEINKVIDEVEKEETTDALPEETQTEIPAEKIVEKAQPAKEVVEPEAEPEKQPGYVPEAVSEKPEEEKTVPLGALHEERQKRKELQRRLDAAEAAKKENLEYEQDEYTQLKNRIEVLESQRKRDSENQIADKETKLIQQVSDELEKEGYPWFKELGADKLRYDFDSMENEDPAYVKSHKNPEGWKKWYKERIFPSIKKVMDKAKQNESMLKKVEAKKNAQLVTTPGLKETSAPEGPKLTPYEEYVKERQQSRL
jgi:hypothetical protein